MDRLRDIERQIASKIVTDAIEAGYNISVCDGGRTFAIQNSTDREAILAAMFRPDGETLFLFRENGCPVGWVCLAYGNTGFNVIQGASGSALMHAAIAGAEKLSEELEAAAYEEKLEREAC